MTQRGNDVSNMCRFVPKLTVNWQFMRDFMAEEAPCFALGLVEERKQPCGFLALRPAEVIPPEISGLGFNFGHALLGTTEFEVVQFVRRDRINEHVLNDADRLVAGSGVAAPARSVPEQAAAIAATRAALPAEL